MGIRTADRWPEPGQDTALPRYHRGTREGVALASRPRTANSSWGACHNPGHSCLFPAAGDSKVSLEKEAIPIGVRGMDHDREDCHIPNCTPVNQPVDAADPDLSAVHPTATPTLQQGVRKC